MPDLAHHGLQCIEPLAGFLRIDIDVVYKMIGWRDFHGILS
jgi:hypothetical protein